MKKLLLLIFFISGATFSQTDGARVLVGSAQPPLPFNILNNTGFEDKTASWSISSGFLTTVNSVTNVARGSWSASILTPVSIAAGVLFQSTSITIPSGLYGRQCVASILYKGNAASNGTMVIEAYDGTVSYGTKALPDSTTYALIQTTVFTCPLSGSLQLRIRTSATSSATPSLVYFDEAYLGQYDNNFVNTARISTAGVVSLESGDWINGNCVNASSVYTCTINPNIYSDAPNCTASLESQNGEIAVQGISLTSFVVKTFDSTGAASNRDLIVRCSSK